MITEEEKDESLHVPSVTPGRIRSHSLKPQHSRIDYARRKSATDISPIDNQQLEILDKTSTPPSSSWIKRRFTFFSLEQPIKEKQRITTDHSSFFDEKSYSDLLKQKRPSLIVQMMESFARRISSRKKKRGSEREREEAQPVIDPVYETLKIAAETRKRAVALYLQQRQQSLNKQTSLNSQGSSELDIQPSPRVIRHNDSTTSTQPQTPSLSPGKRNSAVQFSPVVDKSPYSMRRSK